MMDKYLKAIIERIKPDTTSYVKQPLQAKVIAVQAEGYTCDVQPINEEHPVIPGVKILSIWATSSARVVALPAETSIVVVGFLNGDVAFPYIQGFMSESGLAAQFLIESGNARIWIAEDGKIALESESKVEVRAPEINLGESASEMLIKGDTFQALFNAHTHGTGVGPSSPPIQVLNGSELSEVVRCV